MVYGEGGLVAHYQPSYDYCALPAPTPASPPPPLPRPAPTGNEDANRRLLAGGADSGCAVKVDSHQVEAGGGGP